MHNVLIMTNTTPEKQHKSKETSLDCENAAFNFHISYLMLMFQFIQRLFARMFHIIHGCLMRFLKTHNIYGYSIFELKLLFIFFRIQYGRSLICLSTVVEKKFTTTKRGLSTLQFNMGFTSYSMLIG